VQTNLGEDMEISNYNELLEFIKNTNDDELICETIADFIDARIEYVSVYLMEECITEMVSRGEEIKGLEPHEYSINEIMNNFVKKYPASIILYEDDDGNDMAIQTCWVDPDYVVEAGDYLIAMPIPRLDKTGALLLFPFWDMIKECWVYIKLEMIISAMSLDTAVDYIRDANGDDIDLDEDDEEEDDGK
jgi:hypothetical protein